MSHRRGILSVVTSPETETLDRLEKKLRKNSDLINFGIADLEGTL